MPLPRESDALDRESQPMPSYPNLLISYAKPMLMTQPYKPVTFSFCTLHHQCPYHPRKEKKKTNQRRPVFRFSRGILRPSLHVMMANFSNPNRTYFNLPLSTTIRPHPLPLIIILRLRRRRRNSLARALIGRARRSRHVRVIVPP